MHLSKVYNENKSSLSHNLSKLVEQTKTKPVMQHCTGLDRNI